MLQRQQQHQKQALVGVYYKKRTKKTTMMHDNSSDDPSNAPFFSHMGCIMGSLVIAIVPFQLSQHVHNIIYGNWLIHWNNEVYGGFWSSQFSLSNLHMRVHRLGSDLLTRLTRMVVLWEGDHVALSIICMSLKCYWEVILHCGLWEQ